MCEPLRRKNSSGDDDAIWKSPQSKKRGKRSRRNGAQPFETIPSRTSRQRAGEPLRKVDLVNVAGADVTLGAFDGGREIRRGKNWMKSARRPCAPIGLASLVPASAEDCPPSRTVVIQKSHRVPFARSLRCASRRHPGRWKRRRLCRADGQTPPGCRRSRRGSRAVPGRSTARRGSFGSVKFFRS